MYTHKKDFIGKNSAVKNGIQVFVRKGYFTFRMMIFILVLGLVSCVPQRRLEYLRNAETKGTQPVVVKTEETRIIQNGDDLYIQIYSFSNSATSSIGGQEGSTNITPYSAALVSYRVGKDSCIIFPLIGKIKVAGKTIPEAEQFITNALIQYLNNPSVNIKFVNTNISVLGEVRNPGNYTYSNYPLNIYQALSFAGDITQFGDRKHVKIIRNNNGHVEIAFLDLTKKDIINSPYFYLEANDVIYVNPLQRRFWAFDRMPFELILSAISSTVLVVSFIRQVK